MTAGAVRCAEGARLTYRAVVRLTGDHEAIAVRPTGFADLAAAVGALGLTGPVLAVVGGAAGHTETEAASALVTEVIAPVVRECGAVVVDGATDAGVMRLLGEARRDGPPFPLVGVAVEAAVAYPGHPGEVALEPHHSHFVLVPGATWGEEAPWLARVASLLAGGAPSATALINGGAISIEDAHRSLAENRPVLVLAGTGRAADRIAAAVADPAACRDARLATLAQSAMVRVLEVTDRATAAAALRGALTPGRNSAG